MGVSGSYRELMGVNGRYHRLVKYGFEIHTSDNSARQR